MYLLHQKLKALNHQFFPGRVFHHPKWIVLGVNNLCNLHCKMCDVGIKATDTNFAANLTGTRPVNMPLDLLKRIIDQTARYYPKTKLGYAFTEPLIYPHLIESLGYANEQGLFTSITTNALNLKHKAEGLVQGGLNELYVSLDGPESIHNFIRGHESSFQRAIAGIEKITVMDPTLGVSVFCVLTEWNIGHLEEFIDQIKHLPLNQVGFMHTNFTTQSMADHHNNLLMGNYPATYSNTEEIDVSKMDLKVLQEEMIALRQKEYPFKITFSPEIDSAEGLNKFYHRPGELIGKRCDDVFENVMIKSDGSVIPAHGRCYNLTIGNLYNDNLKEIFNSKIISKFRKDLISHGGLFPACSRCCSAF
ncbi:radical SAM/SPASM domain-containing protein [Marinoscillum sp.]|uniref:radical SAM protein n=1 Tax=Marinoscillum sp. TaxID=2024838 RepID=UPI003BA98506